MASRRRLTAEDLTVAVWRGMPERERHEVRMQLARETHGITDAQAVEAGRKLGRLDNALRARRRRG